MNDRAEVTVRNERKGSGTAGVVARLAGFGDVGDAVLQLDENVVTMVDADAVAGAEVLVDPYSHDSE